MQIFVRGCEGRTLALDLSPEDRVRELCSKLDEARSSQDGGRGGRWGAGERRLVLGGLQLRGGGRLSEQGVREGCTVMEVGALLGGGCDGGTTALQRKFMSQATVKKKDEERDLTEEKRAKWTLCAASGEPLADDVLACELGYLFNKEAILKRLALRKQQPMHDNFKHIQKRSHLFEVKLEVNPDYNALGGHANRAATNVDSRYICPITKKPATGKFPFVSFKPCGHVVSEQCIKEISAGTSECVVCGTPFDKSTDVIGLNPAPERLAERRKALLEARAADKATAKAAKAQDGAKRKVEETSEEKAAKKAKLAELTGAGANVSGISGTLSTSVARSAAAGTASHSNKAKLDPTYASMFAAKKKEGDISSTYDAFWGQGAMAGVLGGR